MLFSSMDSWSMISNLVILLYVAVNFLSNNFMGISMYYFVLGHFFVQTSIGHWAIILQAPNF